MAKKKQSMTPAIIDSLLLNAQRRFSFLRNYIFYYPFHGFLAVFTSFSACL